MTQITSREQLIKHCENAVVPVIRWHNRDSPHAQARLGECWAKLKAGCAYRINEETKSTIWIDVFAPTFSDFENGTQEEAENYETYYLPSIEQLKQVKGGDWY